MSALEQIFKAYDVRGTYPDQIDAALCRRIGAAFARFATEESPGTSRVVVARDMRPSGPSWSAPSPPGSSTRASTSSTSAWSRPTCCTSPPGASTLPARCSPPATTRPATTASRCASRGPGRSGEDSGLGRIRELAGGPEPAPVASPGTRSEAELLAAFADHVRSFVDVALLKPLRIVADTANGMGGLVVPEVFRPLPFQLEVLFPELDGTFPNHPADPIQPENLRDLQARVVETGADIGLAFDGDADRVFLVDEAGTALSGSTTTAIVAAGLLDRNPGRDRHPQPDLLEGGARDRP